MTIETLADLIAVCAALGAATVPGLSVAEQLLLDEHSETKVDIAGVRRLVIAGDDPLGDAFCRIRSAEERRPQGQTYTPRGLVDAMIAWSADQQTPERVVDPGVGSARFLVAAGRKFARAELIGADLDPVAALMARANLSVLGMAPRSRIELADYRGLKLPSVTGPTLYIGNPPYVRHHGIDATWKNWLTRTAVANGYTASQLAGLHVHFFLATLQHAQPGDVGAFVTASEWLDVNYGSLVRQLLTDGLGGTSVHVVNPEAMPFADAITTAAVTCFEVGREVDSIRLEHVDTVAALGSLSGGHPVARQRLTEAPRWTPLLRTSPKLPEGYVELGELARVHRGTVTGANRVWVQRREDTKLPEAVLRPSITRARELFAAGSALADTSALRVVIDLPVELDELSPEDRKVVDRFLRRPEVKGAKSGYVATYRRAWWAVELRKPAPILATYMARRPPAFVQNVAAAGHINIAHGIYPRETMSDQAISNLAAHLRVSVTLGQGRTYAGGLTKFEPREMERLPVPALETLLDANFTPGMG